MFVVSALLASACAAASEPATSDAPATTAVDGGSIFAVDGATTRAAFGSAGYLFAQDRLHTFEISVSDENLATIDDDPTAEEYVEASMMFEGEDIGAVGLRYKGSLGGFAGCTADEGPDFEPAGAKTCRKLSMRVKFNWNDPDTEFYGVRKLQFHSHNLDPTKMHERLGYWLFSDFGVPAPRSTHARVVINGEYVGLFGLTEQVDGRFTRDRFDSGKGNLFKGDWPFTSSFGPRPDDRWRESQKTNEDDGGELFIDEFAVELSEASTEQERRAVLDTWTDADELLRYSVVDRAIRHDDGPFHWYCVPEGCGNQNFYWYEQPKSQTVHLIAWDLDGAFRNISEEDPYTALADGWGEITANCEIFSFGELDRLQRSAACDPLVGALHERDAERQVLIEEFLAGSFSPASVQAKLDEWVELLTPAMAEAAALHDDAPRVEDWLEAVDLLEQDLVTARTSPI